VYATGPGSYLLTGTIEQSYIAHAIAHAACISPDSSHCERPPSDDASAAKSHQNLHPSFTQSGMYPNISPNIYHPNRHLINEPASAPVEERKYDPNNIYGQNSNYLDPTSGRTNGFNREFGFWSAAAQLQPTVLLMALVCFVFFVG